ncbi:MAG: beta/gamma crystallin family protein [Proteobacteria bacterium]|nr:beta/gamma crystallin family protein [Pseudomonadota bacterium]MBW3616683.1 beta/gamma crystallin family protein [Pseudomonadota bacterium]
MNRILAAGAAALATLAAGAASAQQSFPFPFPFGQQQQPYGQTYGSGPSITFYEGENFTGRQVTIYGEERDFSRIGFNDRARSARTSGSFTVCDDSEFRGRCERLTGSIRSLDRLGLNARISSVRAEQGGGFAGGGYVDDDDRYEQDNRYERDGYGRDDRDDDFRPGSGRAYGAPRRDGVQGRSVVFFARPSIGGSDVAARGQSSADQFCRASGHGSAVYFNQGERSRRAVDQDGRLVEAPALRDVLCRLR